MEPMNPVERVIRTFEGRPVDRVPIFCAWLETNTANEILGKPIISQERLMNLGTSRFIFDRFGPQLTKALVLPNVRTDLRRRVQAQVELGFDAIWAIIENSLVLKSHDTLIMRLGSIHNFVSDGYGNMGYMYKGPGIKTRDDFESWPYWPNPDELAHRTHNFFKRIMSEYGGKTCVFGEGDGTSFGMFTNMCMTFGIGSVPIWIKKHPDLVQRYLDLIEEICLKAATALMDAGVPVVVFGDDLAFKTGPFLSPKMFDEIFGLRYRRIIKAIHDRGVKVVLHSCGDNTVLFDMLISWGLDGLHAYEPTSNVDIYNEKKIHGDRVTMIGGLGVDYILTDRSTDKEVVDKVKDLLKNLGPGGRYIMSPAHSLTSLSVKKLRVAIEAVHEYGSYPINIDGL